MMIKFEHNNLFLTWYSKMRPCRLRSLWCRPNREIPIRAYLSTYLCLISECLALHLFQFLQIFSWSSMTLHHFFLNTYCLFLLPLFCLVYRELSDELLLLAFDKSLELCLTRVHFPYDLWNNRLRLFFYLDRESVWVVTLEIIALDFYYTVVVLFFIGTGNAVIS